MATPLTELSKALADAVENAGRNVVAVHESGRSGVSGTLWRDNIVVAAAHTIADLKNVTVTLPDGSADSAEFLGARQRIDLALLKLRKPFSGAVQRAVSSALRVGELVLAVGRRPAGGLLASHGIISGIAASDQPQLGRGESWLRLDLQPFAGFSGGPLVNAEGRVIGINTSGARRSVFTIPADAIDRAITTLLAKGHMPSPYLGIGMQPVRLQAGPEGSAKRALLIVMVEPGGPAEHAGLLVGDIVTALEGNALNSTGELERLLDPESVGRSVRLGIVRGGKQKEISVTIGDRK
jgi:S1-C subfamily serine protease